MSAYVFFCSSVFPIFLFVFPGLDTRPDLDIPSHFGSRVRDGAGEGLHDVQAVPVDGDVSEEGAADPVEEAVHEVLGLLVGAHVVHGAAADPGHVVEEVGVGAGADTEGEEAEG